MKQYQNNRKTRNNQAAYVGIDVAKTVWLVTILTEDMEIKTMSSAPNAKKLADYLKKILQGYTIYSVYEAGYCGFTIHKELVKNGIRNIIVNPADVPKTDKERKTKTDRSDSHLLAYSLRRGKLEGIYVPEEGNIAERDLVRLRETLVKDQTRIKNRIKSTLTFLGIELTEAEKSWSKRYIEKLRNLEIKEDLSKFKLEILLEELKQKREMILKVTKKIREISKDENHKEDVKNLMKVPGIGFLSSIIILSEIMDISRFSNFSSLNCYVGFLPTEHSSGGVENKGHIMPRGNKQLKKILVEAAWVASRTDPVMKKKFEELKKRMKSSKAIIIISKKLLSRIYHVLKTKETYNSLAA